MWCGPFTKSSTQGPTEKFNSPCLTLRRFDLPKPEISATGCPVGSAGKWFVNGVLTTYGPFMTTFWGHPSKNIRFHDNKNALDTFHDTCLVVEPTHLEKY